MSEAGVNSLERTVRTIKVGIPGHVAELDGILTASGQA